MFWLVLRGVRGWRVSWGGRVFLAKDSKTIVVVVTDDSDGRVLTCWRR